MTTSTTLAGNEPLLRFGPSRSLPLMLQAEATECGLACLTMIAGYYGYNTDIVSVRQKFSVSSHGATLKQLMEIATQLELSGRALKLDMQDLTSLQTPCILHWNLNHFVVLKRAKKGRITLHDPAVGERHLTFSEASKSFTGVALELTPTTSFRPANVAKRLNLSHFWQRIKGLKRSLFVVFILSLLLQGFTIAAPYYIQLVIDEVILRSDTNLLHVLAIGFGLLLCIEAGTSCLRQFVLLHFSSRLNLQMASNVFNHLIRLPLEYFSKRHIGDVVSRFSSTGQIRELLTTGLVQVLVDGLMAIITLLVMLFYSVKLTVIVVLVITCYGFLRYVFYTPVKRLSAEQLVASAEEQSHFMETARAIQTIKLCEKETDRQSQWQNKLAASLNKSIQLSRWEIGFDTTSRFLFGLENVLVIFVAATLVMDNVISLGMLFAFVSYKTKFVGATDNLIAKWIEFKMLSVHFDRLADIVFAEKDQSVLSLNNEYGHFEPGSDTSQLQGYIQLRDLSYSYSTQDRPVFNHLNLQIEAGDTLAIVGPSGSGKTTLLKCMMGLFTPTEGRVLIDNRPIDRYPNFRRHIAAVMQDDQLLSGSIGDNIACFAPNVDHKQVVRAAHMACIHEDIIKMPMGYNTLVGDMGASLSGGQKQRILLARALYKTPSILFLDEATSHLDLTNEQNINQHIKHLSVTRIIIAHRPDTIRMADRILRLENGVLSDITAEAKASSTF